MKSRSWMAVGALFVLVLPACAADMDADDNDEEEDEAVESVEEAHTSCAYSSSPQHMFPAARRAMGAAGLADGVIIQSRGNAAASKGTHCSEPGSPYSAATDIRAGSTPCARVRALRNEGFAAFYRPNISTPHIHMVWAGAPKLKRSLKAQIESFLAGRNGLVGNAVETRCPITAGEKAAVRAAMNGGGGSSASGNDATVSGGNCVPGGTYCGGDKVGGDKNTLHVCNGATATVVRKCRNGCVVNPGRDDFCR